MGDLFTRAAMAAEKKRLESRANSAEERINLARQVYRQAASEIQKGYLRGLLNHLGRKHPEAFAEIERAERTVDELWKDLAAGKVPFQKFELAVNRWRELHLESIREHGMKDCSACSESKRGECEKALESGGSHGKC